jgi:DNA-binding response OmpR family regulator
MAKRTVVILELDPQVAGAYELFLASRGYAVAATSSLSGALRAVASESPELVLIGTLPDTTDAGTAAARLRVMASPRPLGVVVMARSMDDVPDADLVIPSGAHPRAVLDAIRAAFKRRPPTAPLATVS